MCGIWSYLRYDGNIITSDEIQKYKTQFDSSKCRGPDATIEHHSDTFNMVFHRLAIHDLTVDGNQPFTLDCEDGTRIYMMCNGEIYNYVELMDLYNFPVKGHSDCEILIHMLPFFDYNIADIMYQIKGEYAFVAYIQKPDGKTFVCISRDIFGVRPLYYGICKDGIIVSSLLSGIIGLNDVNDNQIKGHHFPPGHYLFEELDFNNQLTEDAFVKKCHYAIDYMKILPYLSLEDIKCIELKKLYKVVTDKFIEAVIIRLGSERDVGFLLSGGLDSSLVVAVATKICNISRPKTYCIGFNENATDILYATKVAHYLDTTHHPVIIEPRDALDIIPTVIKCLETYDVTTIRASTPQYLLAKFISENSSIKVILNGDGSDEVSMGYIYNYFAPNDKDAHADSLRLLNEIHCYDGLRVDRTLAAHGLEARVPFLDIDYVRTYMKIPIELRRPGPDNMEKQFLRDAFHVLYPDILPKEILYRRKEAFSDGVSTIKESWFSLIQEKVKEMGCTEKDWYKNIFDTHFPNQSHICPHYWMPQWTDTDDPSARTLKLYTDLNS
jgi:asparagine synthase (glutamine-hydrolysing)